MYVYFFELGCICIFNFFLTFGLKMLKSKLNNFFEVKYVCIFFRKELEIYSLVKYKIFCIFGEWGYNYFYCSVIIYKFIYG